MKKTFCFTVCGLFTAVAATFAALDIVESNAGSEGPVYVLKNTSTGKVLGTFWDRANEKSDYGFESSIVPDFVWSKDRDYVAVSGGASRNRSVFLFKVSGNTLKEIPVPQLDDGQAAPLGEISNPAAEGLDAVRWQQDGTLLLRFWAADTVTDGSGEQKEANVWADLEIQGDKAVIVGTSSEEPSSQAGPPPPYPVAESGEMLASQHADSGNMQQSNGSESDGPGRLAGVHRVSGQNPNGTAYQGTVEIRVVNGLVGMEWKIGDTVSHGNGVLVGTTLGVALDDGVAIYQIVGQSEGLSLIGLWAAAGSSTCNDEAILIENADMTRTDFPPAKINGDYRSLREVGDGQIEGSVTISGGDNSKKVLWNTNGKSEKCQGLSLGDGLAILTPNGLSVLTKQSDSLEGQFVTGNGAICQTSLIPAN